MDLWNEIKLNQFGQGILGVSDIKMDFEEFSERERQKYLLDLVNMIIQSKVKSQDIDLAISNSKLRETFTCCILLRKGGVKYQNLKRIAELPNNEKMKVLILLLSTFKIGYTRRFLVEKNLGKWWYWDLSKSSNIERVFKMFGPYATD